MPRGPLPLLIALEALVLAALGFAGWHLLSGRLTPPASPPPSAATIGLPKPRATPTPSAMASPPSRPRTPVPHATITPGLNTNPAFWQQHLTQINRDEVAWQQIELKAVQAVEAFTRSYLKAVVIPAVQDAAGRSRSP